MIAIFEDVRRTGCVIDKGSVLAAQVGQDETLLGAPDLRIRLEPEGNGRRITLEAVTDRGRAAIPE